jgi:hypothetical protein
VSFEGDAVGALRIKFGLKALDQQLEAADFAPQLLHLG